MIKTTFKTIGFGLICLLASIQSTAQEGSSYTTLSYSPSLALGESADFVEGMQWRGINFSYHYFVSDEASIGFTSGWNVFRTETDGNVTRTLEQGNNIVTLTGKQFRYVNTVPILASARYHWGDKNGLRVFGGLSAGLYYVDRRVEMGLFASDNETGQFGIAPTAGILFPSYGNAGFHIECQYNNAFESRNGDSFSYLDFNVGFSWGF